MMSEKKVWSLLFLVLSLGIIGYFSLRSLTLCSSITGRVTLYHSPLEHLTIQREFHWGWSNEVEKDHVTTDKEGRFNFNPIHRSSFWPALIPHKVAINERLYLKNDGTTYELWMVTKEDYQENSENAGLPVILECDLSSPTQEHEHGSGVCTLTERH